LVFATLLGIFGAFTAHAQGQEFAFVGAVSGADRIINGGRKADPVTPQVTGRVTDFAGRSVKAAKVRFIGVEFDETVTVRTNAFGYYQVAELTSGHSYFVSVNHRRYLFLIAPTEVLVGDEPLEFNFQGELAR
jgi:hypothetical protein